MIALTQGLPAEAIQHLSKAVELDPYLSEAYANLGLAHLRAGDPDAALAALAQAVDLTPDDLETLVRYGQLLQQRHRPSEAIQAYRQAILVRPSFVPAAARLVWLLATSDDTTARDPAQALDLGRKIAQLAPDRPPLLAALAAAYAATGQFDEALQTADRALALAQEQGNAALARRIEGHRAYYQRSEPVPGQSAISPGQ